MKTYFASPERTDQKDLSSEIETVNHSSVISGLLNSVGGLLAILDENRQIVAVNDNFLEKLGIDDPDEALGLRPGEAVNCIHAHEEEAGCGTSKFCSTCGAAIAIVSSLKNGKCTERKCALTASRGGNMVDIALLVRSQPIVIEKRRFLLLFLQDISVQEQRAALERTFFHDINNILVGLVGASEILSIKDKESELVQMIERSSLRLKKELDIQRCLIEGDDLCYQPLWQQCDIKQIIEEVKLFFANHSVAKYKNLELIAPSSPMSIETDTSVLLRVLTNMITNALEATEVNGNVKMWTEKMDSFITFSVENSQYIKPEISRRIFQRNFSTKKGDGRGIGTYSMKLFGEHVLGGKVDFTTSPEKGTVFTFSLPS